MTRTFIYFRHFCIGLTIVGVVFLLGCSDLGQRTISSKWTTDFQQVESGRDFENRITLILYHDDTFEIIFQARGDLRGDPESMTASGRYFSDQPGDRAELIVSTWYAEGNLYHEEERERTFAFLDFSDEMDQVTISYPDEEEPEVLYRVPLEDS